MQPPVLSGYAFQNCLGQGAFGTVWRALWNAEFACAVKVLTPGMWHPHYLGWCLERLRVDEHAGIIRTFSYDFAVAIPHLGVSLLADESVSIELIAGRLHPNETWALIDQLAGVLSWLHQQGVVHIGLSTGNVFVSPSPSGDPVVMVGDTGQGWLSEAPTENLHRQCGFIAPEQWRGATRLLQEGRAQPRDVYAFGVIAWRLLTGQWPRGGNLFSAVAAAPEESLKLDPVPFAEWLESQPPPEWPSSPASADHAHRRAVIENCLSFDLSTRPRNMIAVMQALSGQKPDMPDATVQETTSNSGIVEDGTQSAFAEPAAERKSRPFSLRFPKFGSRRSPNSSFGGLFAPAAALFCIACSSAMAIYLIKVKEKLVAAVDANVIIRSEKATIELREKEARKDAETAQREATEARLKLATESRAGAVVFLEKLLTTQPIDPEQIEYWRSATKPAAEHVSSVLERNTPDGSPELANMNAQWLLASLDSALGEEAKALPILEKLGRDVESATVTAGTNAPPEYSLLSARIAARAGEVLINQRRTADALVHLQKATAAFEKYSGSLNLQNAARTTENGIETRQPDPAISRQFARNLLREGHAFSERGETEKARAAWIRIPGLLPVMEDSAFSFEDRLLLVDAQHEIGKLDALSGNMAAAMTQCKETLEILLAYDQTDPYSNPCRMRLQRTYVAYGRLFAKQKDYNQASIAFSQAVKVLTELRNELPISPAVNIDLGVAYNEVASVVAANHPGSAGAKEALVFLSVIKILKTINAANPLDNSIRHQLASSLVLESQLREAAGEPVEASERANESITLVSELINENTLTDSERRDCARIAARAWTVKANVDEKAGRKAEAKAALAKAVSSWEAAQPGPDDLPVLAAAKERLKKLNS